MMNTLFSWITGNTQKTRTQPLFRAQEIWWCSLSDSAEEQPVLIFRKQGDKAWGLPLASRTKGLYVIPKGKDAVLAKMCVLRSDRLVRRLGKMSDTQFTALNTAVMLSLQETDPLRAKTRTPARRLRPMPRALPIQYAIRRRYVVPTNTYSLKPAM